MKPCNFDLISILDTHMNWRMCVKKIVYISKYSIKQFVRAYSRYKVHTRSLVTATP